VARTFVPSQPSTHTPNTPGTTISSEIVVIRDTHAIAAAIGEILSSSSLATTSVPGSGSGCQKNQQIVGAFELTKTPPADNGAAVERRLFCFQS
jgi:hypothetical protein